MTKILKIFLLEFLSCFFSFLSIKLKIKALSKISRRFYLIVFKIKQSYLCWQLHQHSQFEKHLEDFKSNFPLHVCFCSESISKTHTLSYCQKRSITPAVLFSDDLFSFLKSSIFEDVAHRVTSVLSTKKIKWKIPLDLSIRKSKKQPVLKS